MLYCDYTWDLEPNRIVLDSELDIGKLGWKGGDYFQVRNVNGRAMLVKVDPLVKFLNDGDNNEKYDPYSLPLKQIWTDGDLAKFAFIAFVAGVIVGLLA